MRKLSEGGLDCHVVVYVVEENSAHTSDSVLMYTANCSASYGSVTASYVARPHVAYNPEIMPLPIIYDLYRSSRTAGRNYFDRTPTCTRNLVFAFNFAKV